MTLPIHHALPALKVALAERPNAVLVAAPGAGKTTVTPLALLDEPWARGGRIIVLEPRRLAARAAAARMAWTLGEAVGETVGFRVRMQSRVSARTRIEVVTEGVFTRMILDDPALDGVAAVLFDEFHERSLDADLGLALARDSQAVLREDLRLLVMSATLDGARVAGLLGDAPVIESLGRAFPVETRYLGRDPRLGLVDQVVRAVTTALAETTGSLLVFLPGQGEIRRAAQLLDDKLPGRPIEIAPLYGALDVREQDRAIAPPPAGRRKVVLATSIAETSLTLEGIGVVIDCGLARVPRYDPARGLTRLETVRVAQAQADQRRGRAGRTEPGVCYRLWDEAETRALPAFGRPEILEADLSRLALDLARWGAKDASGLAFLDPPPAAAMTEARRLLVRLDALDAHGDLTAHGRAIAELPLAPRLAHMVLKGAGAGAAERAARIAVLLTEHGLGGSGVDLHERLERLGHDRSPRARDARALASRWASAAGGAGEGDGARRRPADRRRLSRADRPGARRQRRISARQWPRRLSGAHRRPGAGTLAGGGGTGRRRGARSHPVGRAAGRGRPVRSLRRPDRDRGPGPGRRRRPRHRDPHPPAGPPDHRGAPDRAARPRPDRRRPAGPGARERARRPALERGGAAAARARSPSCAGGGEAWPDLSDAALQACADDWLAPLLIGRTRLDQIGAGELDEALRGLIGWEQQRGSTPTRRRPGPRPPVPARRSTTRPRAGPRSRCGCRSCSAWPPIPVSEAAASP